MKMYLLIDTDDFSADDVTMYIERLQAPDVQVRNVDAVAGPYELIASVESESLDLLNAFVQRRIVSHPGVKHVTACMVRPASEPPEGARAAQQPHVYA